MTSPRIKRRCAHWLRPVEVRPYLLSYEHGKSSTRLFAGQHVWEYLISAGLILDRQPPNPSIPILHEWFFGTDGGPDYCFTFNPKSKFGRAILSYPFQTRLLLMIEATLHGSLLVCSSITEKRIRPLLPRKRFIKKRAPNISKTCISSLLMLF